MQSTMRTLAALALGAALLTGGSGTVEAAETAPAVGPRQDTLTRSLGMGNAFYAHGAGNSALFSNPAAMSLVTAYSVEGSYLNIDGTNVLHASVVDTKTSALGAGFGYSYFPVDGEDTHDTRLGLAAAPIPGVLAIGALGQYTWQGSPDVSGFSLDLGVAASLAKLIGLGVVAHNLLPNEDLGERRTLGFGVAVTGPLTAAFDLDLDLDESGSDRFGYHGGLEFLAGGSYPLRVGYEAWPVRGGAQYICFGLGALSQAAGIQLAFRQRLDEGSEQTFAVSLNMFL